MKKLRVNFVGILFAVLSLVFTACNSMLAGGETGTVRVVIGGGASARSINPSNGLPVFDDTNTKITVTDEDGNQLAQGTTSVTLKVGINRKITVEATITTPIGIWRGSVEHPAPAGTTPVAVKRSKARKGFANLLFSITGGGVHSSGGNIVSLSTQNGKKLLDGILIGTKPITARDKIGRIYVLYEDTSSNHHFKRFDVEGNEDTSFSTSGLSGVVSSITDIAVDIKTDTLFFVNRMPTGWALYFTNKENAFNLKGPFSIPIPSGYTTAATIPAAIAAYNGMVYIALATNASPPLPLLLAYEAVLSGSTLTLTHKATQELSKLRTDSAFDNNHTNCTGLFADASGVYCLLAEENATRWASESYAVGKLIRYEYSGGTLTKKTEQGFNPAAPGSDRPIPFDDRYFFYPTGFIGSDENNIYIADDGFGIQYKNENWHIMNNRNRIAAFNRETDSLSFSDSGATWYDEKPEYKLPNTKILLWEKRSPTMALSPMNYWISTDGTEAFSGTNKLFGYSSSPIEKPTDVFCYDQDGNLYILWKDSSNYNVRRFELKEDGTYNKPGVDLTLTAHTVPAIAVDISGGQNYLYYIYEDGPNTHIQRYRWDDTSFSTATPDSTYGVHISSTSNKIFFTALAANKDGVFVGVKETYQDSGINKYRLKVQKYARTAGPAHLDGGLTLVDNALEYTDSLGNPIDSGSFTDNIRIQYMEAINDLQVFNGVLYALSSKSCKIQKDSPAYFTDAFKNSGILYKIGSTNGSLSENAVVLAKKDWNDTSKIGYGFYRFIAVKCDEAERIKLIIASDSAWGKDGLPIGNPLGELKNTDKVLEYDLKDNLQTERNSGGSFSKTLKLGSGFEWY